MTKQGDPLSSLLFNTVLQKALEENIPRWQKKRGMGLCVSDNDHDCLANMRFADDVFLFATSCEQLRKMMCEFNPSTEKVGLKLNPGKTKSFGDGRILFMQLHFLAPVRDFEWFSVFSAMYDLFTPRGASEWLWAFFSEDCMCISLCEEAFGTFTLGKLMCFRHALVVNKYMRMDYQDETRDLCSVCM